MEVLIKGFHKLLVKASEYKHTEKSDHVIAFDKELYWDLYPPNTLLSDSYCITVNEFLDRYDTLEIDVKYFFRKKSK